MIHTYIPTGVCVTITSEYRERTLVVTTSRVRLSGELRANAHKRPLR